MQWCRSCVLPDSRPNLTINSDGVCSACETFRGRAEIDWQQRERAFETIVDNAKLSGSEYDCLVPVSGGKDSTWQVVKCLEYGLKPLAVSWRPPARTSIGQKNLNNLKTLGVDHIDFSINPEIESTFMRKTFVEAGSSGIPMHYAIFAIPLKIAVNFNISLIVWGENSAIEYGGGPSDKHLTVLDEAWLSKYGVAQGFDVLDWCDDWLTKEALSVYQRSDVRLIKERNIQAVFLGNYFPWDPEKSLRVAQENGFEVRLEGAKTGYYDYADIDDDFISIHHWLKWYKFGFTRLFDNLSLEIRNGRMDRTSALEILRSIGADKPEADIDEFCNYTGLSSAAFDAVCERFRNRNIWRREGDIWKISNFILCDWDWS